MGFKCLEFAVAHPVVTQGERVEIIVTLAEIVTVRLTESRACPVKQNSFRVCFSLRLTLGSVLIQTAALGFAEKWVWVQCIMSRKQLLRTCFLQYIRCFDAPSLIFANLLAAFFNF